MSAGKPGGWEGSPISSLFTHMHVHSPYSFLDGGSSIEALVKQAAFLGMPYLALTDHNSLAGVVKFRAACEQYAITPIFGAELTMEDRSHLTMLAETPQGYANLCSLISRGHTEGDRRSPALSWESLRNHAEGLICLSGCRKGRLPTLVREHRYAEAEVLARELVGWFGGNLVLELQDDFTPQATRVCRDLVGLAAVVKCRVVATNNVHFATPHDFTAHDTLRCIANGITVDELYPPGKRTPTRPLNREQYLKSASEMSRVFAWCPEVIAESLRIAERCSAAFPEASRITPHWTGGNATHALRSIATKGAHERYGKVTPKITARLTEELTVIAELGFCDYVLEVYEIVRWARGSHIRCSGRGSAADSCTAFCLYLTDVDVIERGLPFERFLVPGKCPDIDVDFDSRRRDEVFVHIQQKHGEAHVGLACVFHTFQARSAVRDVGKALGLPEDALAFLRSHLSGWAGADELTEMFSRRAELKPYSHLVSRFATLFSVCGKIADFPRHIGSHSSGVVISSLPLRQIAPVIPSAKGVLPIWTLDKDDSESIGAIKFDVLGIRMLSAITDTVSDIHRDDPTFSYDHIPMDDTDTFAMIQAGKAIGAFQFESSAQLSLAVRLLPSEMSDLDASVALIRPGPVRSNVVQRFVDARNGYWKIDCLHECLKPVLMKTYGCVLYQEQVTAVIALMSGCSTIEAEGIRKSLKRHAKAGTIEDFRREFMRTAMQRHPDLKPYPAFLIAEQVVGWSGYGFLEGHAAAFAQTGYKTAYLSRHFPAQFFASLLNHQPMGFYSANSLAAEARRRGVRILALDINESSDKSYAPEETAIRLGLRLVTGLGTEDIGAIEKARGAGAFTSLVDFCTRVLLKRNALETLILAGAFDALHPNRRGLLFSLDEGMAAASSARALLAIPGPQPPLPFERPAVPLVHQAEPVADFSLWDAYCWSWRITGVAADCHPFSHFREGLTAKGFLPVAEALTQKHNTRVWVAGINLRPHRPPTASGNPVLFASVEDETDLLQLVCVGDALEEYTGVFLQSHALIIEGVIQRKGRGATLFVLRAKPFRARTFTLQAAHQKEAALQTPAHRTGYSPQPHQLHSLP